MRARQLAALFAACLALSAPARERPAPAAASEEDLRQLRGRIENLSRELAQAEESRGEAAGALKAAEKAVSEANRALFVLDSAHRTLTGELEALAAQGARAREEIAGQRALAERLLRLQYEQGGQDRLRLLLEGRDLATVSRHLAYFGYVQRARAEALDRLRRGAEEIARLEAEARDKRAALAENQQAQSRESRRLEKERTERAAVLHKIADQVARNRKEIGRLKRDEARLARLVQEIAQALAASETRKARERQAEKAAPRREGKPVDQVADASLSSVPFASLKGRLRLPVKGELMNRYGSPREDGGTLWRGLFIRTPVGELVRAVADGRVVYADWLRGFGNLLILDHGSGYMSLYGYNEGLLRAIGEGVRGGDPVARVGSSGGGEESGLYFELRLEGKPFDPMRWVAR